ncbi:glycosyltransferase family 1 protein [Sphingomonas sp. BGYR3]|uniref:glycosyltransferase family 4 protein n=1 Tax=Sphingomonas sp. BGYR3 TaxID=2975483 RepID=UPI0021A3DD73|nr:glycosyltransferase family 1 protein [Sphingomonas sp. BGYR3]MDG5488098.1 glycosyltransferase family 1 protein [Sphingomonas sp. BGYR3]
MKPTDLRIALFSGNYNYVRDGANQALNLLAGYLLERGVTLRVYSPTVPEPAFPATGELVDIPALALPGGRDEYRLGMGLPLSVRADLKAYAPNIVHVSAPDVSGHRAVTWARRRKIPTLASLHTRFETYAQYYGIGFLEPLAINLSTRFYNRVDRVMVPSPSMGDVLRDWGVTTPIGIWSRGINHDRFNPGRRDLTWRRSLGIGDDEVAVSFLGRLVLEKGLGIFADVIAELKARGVPHKVLVIGEGPARHWFAERVPEAVFTGFQSGDDLGRAVAGMDVFFMPSVTETFGNVTTEAMAAGVPVVAARATGAVDLVEEGVTGFLVPPTDVRAYADAIQKLVEDPALRRSSGQAGHRAAQRFIWDTANQAVLDAYRDLLTAR